MSAMVTILTILESLKPRAANEMGDERSNFVDDMSEATSTQELLVGCQHGVLRALFKQLFIKPSWRFIFQR